jgi:hypothetical protein
LLSGTLRWGSTLGSAPPQLFAHLGEADRCGQIQEAVGQQHGIMFRARHFSGCSCLSARRPSNPKRSRTGNACMTRQRPAYEVSPGVAIGISGGVPRVAFLKVMGVERGDARSGARAPHRSGCRTRPQRSTHSRPAVHNFGSRYVSPLRHSASSARLRQTRSCSPRTSLPRSSGL